MDKQVTELLAALEGLFEHCAMVHKHWGDGGNQKEADAAIKTARDTIAKVRGKASIQYTDEGDYVCKRCGWRAPTEASEAAADLCRRITSHIVECKDVAE